MIWIGLDPSIAAFGWALLTREGPHLKLVDLGSWCTKVDHSAGKFADRARRCADLCAELSRLLVKVQPGRAFIEAPIFKPNDGKMSIHASARTRGNAEALVHHLGIPLLELPPQSVKKAITGSGDASKEEVARRVFQLLGDRRILTADDNATDAVAVAMVGDGRWREAPQPAPGLGRVLSRISSGVVRTAAPQDPDDLGF